MEEEPKTKPLITAMVAIAVVVAAGSIFLVDQPFQPRRPQETETQSVNKLSTFRYLRLWEDPFEPFQKVFDSEEAGTPATVKSTPQAAADVSETAMSQRLVRDPAATATIADEVNSHIANRSILALPILLPGGPYVEERETRARIRYAVVSALFAKGFQPRAYRQIGYYEPFPRAVVPYEWFCRPDCPEQLEEAHENNSPTSSTPPAEPNKSDEFSRAEKRQMVLMLWLDEDELVRTPNPQAALKAYLPFLKTGGQDLRVSIIGPTTSTVLIKWARARPKIGASPLTADDATMALVEILDSYLDHRIPQSVLSAPEWGPWQSCVHSAFSKFPSADSAKQTNLLTADKTVDSIWGLYVNLADCSQRNLVNTEVGASIDDSDKDWWEAASRRWLAAYGTLWFRPKDASTQLFRLVLANAPLLQLSLPISWRQGAGTGDVDKATAIPAIIDPFLTCTHSAKLKASNPDYLALSNCINKLPPDTSNSHSVFILPTAWLNDIRRWVTSAALRSAGFKPTEDEINEEAQLLNAPNVKDDNLAQALHTLLNRSAPQNNKTVQNDQAVASVARSDVVDFLYLRTSPLEWYWSRLAFAKHLEATIADLRLKNSTETLIDAKDLKKVVTTVSQCVAMTGKTQALGERELDDQVNKCIAVAPAGRTRTMSFYNSLVSYFTRVRSRIAESNPPSCDADALDVDELIGCAPVYNARATAHHKLSGSLVPPEIEAAMRGSLPVTPPYWFWPQLHPTIWSDDRLAELLVAELRNRRVDICSKKPKDRVVLVGELDTFYGRSFREAFENAVRGATCRNVTTYQGDPLDGVLLFGYLQGLDGATPRNVTKSASDETQTERIASRNPLNTMSMLVRLRESIEYPVGAPQLDYIRRLAQRIAEATSPSGSADVADASSPVKAIGVIGSDVYDKAIAVQALRVRFPDAILFTTDLDARLSHPKELPWTRGLIVATGYSLVPPSQSGDIHGKDENLQVPSFRDGYQTATFVAAMNALEDAFSQPAQPTQPGHPTQLDAPTQATQLTQLELRQPPDPKLFEIGTRFPVQLGSPAPISKGNVADPARVRIGNSQTFRVGIFCFLLGILLLSVFNLVPRAIAVFTDRSDRYFIPQFIAATVLSLVVLAALWWILQKDAASPSGEPFRWFEGISAWPTELIRWFTGAVGLVAIPFMLHSLRNCDIAVSHLVNVHDKPRSLFAELIAQLHRTNLASQPKRELLRKVLSSLSLTNWTKELQTRVDEGAPRVQWHDVWGTHKQLSRMRIRTLRTVILMLQLGVVYKLLITVTGDSEALPARGATIYYVNRVMEVWAVGIATFATFFFVDATRLATALIDYIGGAAIVWKSENVSTRVSTLGVPESAAGELLGTLVIGEYTEAIGWMIMVPAILLFLLVAARSSYLDSWGWPLPLATCICVLGLYVVAKAILLRRSAERARRNCITRLQECASQLAIAGPEARVAQINLLISRIQSYDKGAFSSWSKNPVLRAMLLPAGGFGILELLNIFTLF